MKTKNKVLNMVVAALFLAIAYVLPFVTGQIPQIGAMLCPMHIPVLLCGFICGGQWGFLVGVTAPLLRSAVLTMPPMFPTAVCMAVELAVYGAVSGILYRILPKKKSMIYVTLLVAMLSGRLVWGAAMLICAGINESVFGISAFVAGAVTNAIPGIVIQIVLIPILIISLEKANVLSRDV